MNLTLSVFLIFAGISFDKKIMPARQNGMSGYLVN